MNNALCESSVRRIQFTQFGIQFSTMLALLKEGKTFIISLCEKDSMVVLSVDEYQRLKEIEAEHAKTKPS